MLVAQQSLFDPSRAPAGQHTLWTYCHVPAGSTVDMTRRASSARSSASRRVPGRRDRPPRRWAARTSKPSNANYIGGDITGGVADFRQLFTRPRLSLRPWTTGARGLYLCSASTPPGAGVHGMCGLHAARLALRRELR